MTSQPRRFSMTAIPTITKGMVDTTTPSDTDGTQYALVTNVQADGALVATYDGVEPGTGNIVVDMQKIPNVANKSFSSCTVDQYGRVVDGVEGIGTSLPVATAAALGCVIVGDGLSIDGQGVLSAPGLTPYVLPIATADVLGGVKLGAGLTSDISGVVAVQFPVATDSILGCVKITQTSGMNIEASGSLSRLEATRIITDSEHTISATDVNRFLSFTNGTVNTLMLTQGSGILNGQELKIEQASMGQIRCSAEPGVTVRCAGIPNTRTQYSVITLRKVEDFVWLVYGDVEQIP